MMAERGNPAGGTPYDVPSADGPDADVRFLALRLPGADYVPIVVAGRNRDWMSGRFARSARRCLPLTMANQAGWLLLNPTAFTATWDGAEARGGIRIEYDERPPVRLVEDQFGSGTVSFRVPYLFRTPRGWNTLARGPANHVKDAVSPLEGLVETDWAVSTFTMNWKITRPDHPVRFDAGEPFCMVLPQRRDELERCDPRIERFSDYPRTRDHLLRWSENRREQLLRSFLGDYGQEPTSSSEMVELQYLRGLYPDGGLPEQHATRMRLRQFSEPVDPK